MKQIIELTPENFRVIRTEYFHFSLEFVAKHTGLSINTIRHAEMGISVRKENIEKLVRFYQFCREVKIQIRNTKETKSIC